MAKSKVSERFIHLEGAGVVRIVAAFNLFALDPDQRDFVSGLIDLCNGYERKRLAARPAPKKEGT